MPSPIHVEGESIFSYTGLRRYLRLLHQRHGTFPLRSWAGQSGVILRHDVDLDLNAALRLAEEEAEEGISASYFLLTTAETYNLMAPEPKRKVREMAMLGAEVGLHFDPTVYPDADAEGLRNAAKSEAELIEQILGQRVASISLHNPSVHGKYPIFQGFRNAYDPEIFVPDRYLSDSQMRFQSDPLTFFSSSDAKTYQLLLHPMHYSREGNHYPAPQLRYLKNLAEDLNRIFSVNSAFRDAVCGSFVSHLSRNAMTWSEEETD